MTGLRVLIVDDDIFSRSMLSSFVARHAEVATASDGEEALAKAIAAYGTGRGFDLILLDLIMPRMDGRAALEALMAHEAAAGIGADARSRVVVVSALSERDSTILPLRPRIESFLDKPYTLREIGELLKGVAAKEGA